MGNIQKRFFSGYNLTSTSFLYGRILDERQGVWGVSTSGSSITVTAVAGTPFSDVQVGDLMTFRVTPDTVYRRKVATKVSNAQITVDTAVNLGASCPAWSYYPFQTGTTITDGWHRAEDIQDKTVWVDLMGIITAAGGVDVQIEGRNREVDGVNPVIILGSRNYTAASATITMTGVSSPGVKAQGTITMTGVAVANETFVVGAQTFTWKAARALAGEVTIGASAAAAVTNIVTAITADLATVTAADGAGDTVVVTAAAYGTAGNAIVFTEASTNMAVDGAGTLGTTTAGVTADTFVIGSQTFTWVDLRASTGQVTVGANAPAAVTNIVTAVNTDLTTVRAVDGAGDTVVLYANGTAGNSIALTESSTNMAVSGATLSGGVDGEAILITEAMAALRVGVKANTGADGTDSINIYMTGRPTR